MQFDHRTRTAEACGLRAASGIVRDRESPVRGSPYRGCERNLNLAIPFNREAGRAVVGLAERFCGRNSRDVDGLATRVRQGCGLRRTSCAHQLRRVRQVGGLQSNGGRCYAGSGERDALWTADALVAHVQRGRSRSCGSRSEHDADVATGVGRQACSTIVGLCEILEVHSIDADVLNDKRGRTDISENYDLWLTGSSHVLISESKARGRQAGGGLQGGENHCPQ